MLVTAFVTAAVLLVPVLLVVSDGGERDAEPTTNPLFAGGGSPAPAQPDPVGPEGVPLLEGAPLGPAASPAAGASRGGIPCGSGEQLAYHVHARLTLYVNGKPRSVPLGIGIGKPRNVTETPGGPFISSGSCFAFLHTHAANGIIHVEAPAPVRFTLGQFFDLWRQPLGERRLGRHRGTVVAYVNGRRYRGNPRAIRLRKHAQIQLEVGQPIVAPQRIEFPAGM